MRSALLFYIILLVPGLSWGGGELPEDTLDHNEDIKKWRFWDGDLSIKEALSSRMMEGKKVRSPISDTMFKDQGPKGIGLLAVKLYVPDSLVGEPFRFKVMQMGASEIFIDTVRIGRVGKVAASTNQEKRRYTRFGYNYQHVFERGGDHLLSLRFSDQTWNKEKDEYEERFYGVKGVRTLQVTPESSNIYTFRAFTIIGSIGGFLVALGVVHLLIFLFYPKKSGNLYYMIFVWVYAFLLVSSILIGLSESPVHRLVADIYRIYAFLIFSYSLLSVLYAFLRPKGFGMVFWGLVGTGLLLIFLSKIPSLGIGLSIVLLAVPLVLFESLRIIFVALIRKVKGSFILGVTAGIFILIPAFIFLFGKVGIQFSSGVGASLVFLWGLLFPVGMSVYLARDFAVTSKGLEQKLQEVEELNQKNLEQEREKQRILEEKKEELEEKVEERTRELKERKEEVEEAHREIRDSINYAQGIQEAVLPEEERYEDIGEHFIHFRPRDPVSGDFHWGRKEGDHFYVAAVDCTGHGVPGGFMSMLGVSYLNEIMANEPDASAGDVLTYLKERVVKELSGRKGTAKDGMDAALLKISDPKSQTPKSKKGIEVEFAGANNPLYWIRASGEEEIPNELPEGRVKPFKDHPAALELKGDKGSIGYEEQGGVEEFRTLRFNVFHGDALYIFSDGYADQFGGPKGKKFRYGPFKRLLADIADKPMAEQKVELDRQFEEWKSDREQVDDVLVIGVRV